MIVKSGPWCLSVLRHSHIQDITGAIIDSLILRLRYIAVSTHLFTGRESNDMHSFAVDYSVRSPTSSRGPESISIIKRLRERITNVGSIVGVRGHRPPVLLSPPPPVPGHT